MSKSATHAKPQILVNGEQQEQQQEQQQEEPQEQQQEQQQEEQQEEPQEQQQGIGDDAEEEEHASAGGQNNGRPEDNPPPEKENEPQVKEPQVKMQSVLQQVREQIRSQVAPRAQKSSILELVQRVKDREVEVGREPEGKDVYSEENRHADMSLKEQELCAKLEQKLEACKKALRDEFEQQVSQACREMQAYTDKALKELECKLQSRQQTHPRDQHESKGADRKQKPAAAAPSLAARRGRVLTRTMTTIIPKTCAPVIMGPRAKSETLIYSKGVRSRLLPRDPAPSLPGTKPHQSRRPLPPTYPLPPHQGRKPVWGKMKSGN